MKILAENSRRGAYSVVFHRSDRGSIPAGQ